MITDGDDPTGLKDAVAFGHGFAHVFSPVGLGLATDFIDDDFLVVYSYH
jgi:hypothetical protein